MSLLTSITGTVDADAVRFVSADAVGGTVEYSHSDQIGTIQKLTDATGTLVWDRIARPFGETVSINSSSGVEQKLRFPGQYTDETGLSYNYFRDYDPALGRYVESDPIGLSGGINTYAYAEGNPLLFTDPRGLARIDLDPDGGRWLCYIFPGLCANDNNPQCREWCTLLGAPVDLGPDVEANKIWPSLIPKHKWKCTYECPVSGIQEVVITGGPFFAPCQRAVMFPFNKS